MSLIERGEDIQAVGDLGYRRIRSDIVFGRLRPGQKLKLEDLKESYGVSVSTLREILSRLTAEDFVLAEGRRGFEVAAVSVENLKELAELRLLLEAHAMEVSFANADVEWEGRVVSAHHKLASTERLMESQIGELDQWKRYDSEFHQALISRANFARLESGGFPIPYQ
jgi:GntR family transcriptional regulator, carbon starvation induced regulator